MKHSSVAGTLASMIVALSSAHAYEPPRVLVADALRAGRIAFVGRVVQLQELSTSSEHEALGLARLVVTQCLYGTSCNERMIEMEYTLDTDQDRKFGVDSSVTFK